MDPTCFQAWVLWIPSLKLTTRSRQVAVKVKNLLAILITIAKDVKVAQVVAANAVPQVDVVLGTLEKLNEIQGIQWTRMSVKWRREVLFQQLDLSGLEGWSDKSQVAAHALLAEYHDISLEPGDLDCTDLAKHEITCLQWTLQREVPKNSPTHGGWGLGTHEGDVGSGTIHPSQSWWCNAVVVVCKKDGGVHFCIDFCKLNARTKKDSFPLPQIQEAIESLVGTGFFSCLYLKAGFWQIAMDEVLKQYTAFTVVNLGSFKCECMPLGLCNTPAMFKRLMQNCLRKLNLICCLIYLDNVIVFLKVEEEHLQCLQIVFNCFREHNLRIKPTKCKFFKNEINYMAHHVSREGVLPSKENLKAVVKFVPPQIYTEIPAFLGLMGHYQQFIKGFTCIAQPMHEHLSGEGASKKN